MTDVLILEDELTSLQALSEILTTYSDDIRVHKASSLKEAKDLLDQEIRYGLFLLLCQILYSQFSFCFLVFYQMIF